MRPQRSGSMTVAGEGKGTSEASPPGLLITIVEDNPLIRQLMAEEIEDEGHRVSSFSSAEEFLPVAAKLNSDLVLLDLMLPGMDGLACLRELRQLPTQTPHRVVVVTALNDTAAREQALSLGALDYILKPDLFERLPQLLAALKTDCGDC